MAAALLIIVAAFAAGALNAIAGGGSFLTFPALVFAGVAPVAANATSTVALFPAQASASWGYRHDIGGITEISLPVLAVLSLIGGGIGALLLLLTPNSLFSAIVPWLLCFATVVFAVGSFAPGVMSSLSLGRIGIHVVQFFIAIYGGYFGGGIGILMLAGLTLFGMRDIHAMNGLKILLAGVMNATAVVTFVVAGVVHWPQALMMAASSIFGGYAGAIYGKRLDPRHIKTGVVILGAGLTVYFFYHGA